MAALHLLYLNIIDKRLFCIIINIMPDTSVTHDDLLREFGGRDKNDLNKILTNSQHDYENPISSRSFSPYMYYDDLKNYLRNNINGLSVLSLKIQNIFSKFE